MTFKEFEAWCNERACDGCWSMRTATFCINIVDAVNGFGWVRKERFWRELNRLCKIEENIVRPINEMIESLRKEV